MLHIMKYQLLKFAEYIVQWLNSVQSLDLERLEYNINSNILSSVISKSFINPISGFTKCRTYVVNNKIATVDTSSFRRVQDSDALWSKLTPPIICFVLPPKFLNPQAEYLSPSHRLTILWLGLSRNVLTRCWRIACKRQYQLPNLKFQIPSVSVIYTIGLILDWSVQLGKLSTVPHTRLWWESSRPEWEGRICPSLSNSARFCEKSPKAP